MPCNKIDVPGRLLSAVLVKDVVDFDHYNNEIAFSAHRSVEEQADITSEYYVGYLKLGDRESTILEELYSPVKVAIGKFYDSKYIATLDGEAVSIHQIDSYEDEPSDYTLTFSPDTIKVGHNGEFLLLTKEHTIATVDLEANLAREWTIEDYYGWLDNDMLYTVSNGDLIVYDFDGLNRRVISHNVSSHFPVAITSDKWLYYFSDDNLVREWLIAK